MQYITAQILINEFHRRFKPSNDSWVNDIYDIVGDVIEYIGIGYELLELTSKELDITNGRTRLTMPYTSINKITHNCKPLNILGLSQCYECKSQSSAKINGSYLETIFDTGKVVVHYYTLRVNENGYPEIPNIVEVREACVWSIMYNWLLQGNRHPVIEIPYAEEKREYFISAARNNIKSPTINDEVNFMNIWLTTQIHNSISPQNKF